MVVRRGVNVSPIRLRHRRPLPAPGADIPPPAVVRRQRRQRSPEREEANQQDGDEVAADAPDAGQDLQQQELQQPPQQRQRRQPRRQAARAAPRALRVLPARHGRGHRPDSALAKAFRALIKPLAEQVGEMAASTQQLVSAVAAQIPKVPRKVGRKMRICLAVLERMEMCPVSYEEPLPISTAAQCDPGAYLEYFLKHRRDIHAMTQSARVTGYATAIRGEADVSAEDTREFERKMRKALKDLGGQVVQALDRYASVPEKAQMLLEPFNELVEVVDHYRLLCNATLRSKATELSEAFKFHQQLVLHGYSFEMRKQVMRLAQEKSGGKGGDGNGKNAPRRQKQQKAKQAPAQKPAGKPAS